MKGDPVRFGATHSGELTRTDGLPFDLDAAAEALFGWQIALSFALGRWSAPALPTGYRADGARAWEQWADWRCDQIPGYRSWWTSAFGEDLRDFAKLFLDAWSDHDRRPLIRNLAHHIIAANHSSTTVEGRIMLAQAGIEYLSWVKYVIIGGRSRTQYNRDAFSDHLNELLAEASIPNGIPADLPGLAQYAAQEHLPDGPAAVARLRNTLVHPKDADEPYRIEMLVAEAWQLSMQYAELLLLYELAYSGKYLPRIPASRWAGNREPVPWSP
jgi:hypothetical protein